jgi:light-regulated signal transduction histidine kinase (bacteriophytochrome)
MSANTPAPPLDLSRCEDEPIHIPGSIQPHGVLLALEAQEQTITWTSSNTSEVLGIPVDEVLGRPLSNLLDEESIARLRDVIASASPRRVGPIPIRAAGRDMDGIVHLSGNLAIVELESLPSSGGGAPPDLFGEVDQAVERISRTSPCSAAWQAVAEEVRRVTGFDRVMIYQFHPDDHGEVIAESRPADMEPYLHLHYPASDIPSQARRLYQLNWLRLIVDVEAKPVALISNLTSSPSSPEAAIDLSHSVLRSVSPIHIEYLRNMDVRASMSVSLLVDGRLWGLIACHHRTARHLPYRVRSWCELLARILSWHIDIRQRTEEAEAKARASTIAAELVKGIAEVDDIIDALTAHRPSVLDLFPATGAAVSWNGRLLLLGDTPSGMDVRDLVRWVSTQFEEDVFATDDLSAHWPRAKALQSLASGLLALRVSRGRGPYVLWFRKEQIRTIDWAGNPTQPALIDPISGKLGPRRSFEMWHETVSGRAQPWHNWEINVARELQGPVVKGVLRHLEELEQLNQELRDALQARDLFLAMASHELRTPISTLQLQVQGLARIAERDCETLIKSEHLVSRLESVRRQTTRLSRTMDEMLDAARMSTGRFDLAQDDVDLGELVRDIVRRTREDLERQGCTLTLELEEGVRGRWDRFRIGQVVGNLLSNAVRYGAGRPVTITVQKANDEAILRVRDEGIGVPKEAQELIFERFQRAVVPTHYQGLGLGLWIVREIVSHMRGRIEVHSEVGKGAEFVVMLPIVARNGGK